MRVGILGLGTIGAGIAARLRERDVCDLVLWSRNGGKAASLVFDIEASLSRAPRSRLRLARRVEDVGGVDHLIVSLGATIGPRQRRTDVFGANLAILRRLRGRISSPRGYLIVLTNPVESICEHLAVLLDLNPHAVVGVGGDLDLARLRAVGGSKDTPHAGLARSQRRHARRDRGVPPLPLAL